MSKHVAQGSPLSSSSNSRGPGLRVRGIVILILVLTDILLGNQLALTGSPFPPGYLVAHVIVTAAVVGFAAHSVVIAFRAHRWSARVATLLTLVTSVGATVAGAAFLLEGEAAGPLRGMEILGGLAFLGALLVVVIG